MSDRILFKIQISACGKQMLAYNEDKSLYWESEPDVNVITHFFPDMDFPSPKMDDNGNIIGWDIEEASSFGELMNRKAYAWGHMDKTIIVFDELYEGDYDLVGW